MPEGDRAPGPARPLAFAALLVTAWSARLLLLPWQDSLAPGWRVVSDQVLVAAVFALLPMAWWLAVDPVSWRVVVHPLRGGGRTARWTARAAAIVYVLALRLTEAADGGPLVALPLAAPPAAIALVALGAAARAAVEEALFRGYLLGRLRAAGTSFALANGVQAAAFTALHAPGWLLVSGRPPGEALALVATTAVFALIAGTLARMTGGLALPVLTHATVNILSGAGWSGTWSPPA